MRTYLVVIDDTPEARVALRFASRRAVKTQGNVVILAMVPRPEFVQWGGVQAAMEAEAYERAELLLNEVGGELIAESGLHPEILVRKGEPTAIIRALLDEFPAIRALVLGAAATGKPGPLVSHFAGTDAGSLPCPVMIIPGSLDDEAIDALS
jgi:nucleotide-binding universal stress UspA family protein